MKWYKTAAFIEPIEPKGNTAYGLMGYSRIFDLACMYLETMGLVALSKEAHTASYAIDDGDPPEYQIILAWGPEKPSGPGVRVSFPECENGCSWEPMTPGDYEIRTDSMHCWHANFNTVIHSAFHDLLKRTGKATSSFGLSGKGGPGSGTEARLFLRSSD